MLNIMQSMLLTAPYSLYYSSEEYEKALQAAQTRNMIIGVLALICVFLVPAIAKSKGLVRRFGEPKQKGSKKMTLIVWAICGFFFSVISLIFVLVVSRERPYNPNGEDEAESIMQKEVHDDKQILENGGWRCSFCGAANSSFMGFCKCGKSKAESKKAEERS